MTLSGDFGNFKVQAECPTTQPVPPARMVPPDAPGPFQPGTDPIFFQIGDAPPTYPPKVWLIVTIAWSRRPELVPLATAMLP